MGWNWPFYVGAILGVTLAYHAHMVALGAIVIGAGISAPASMAAVKLLNGNASAQIRAASWSMLLAIVNALSFLIPVPAVAKNFVFIVVCLLALWLKVKFSALPYVAAFGGNGATASIAQTWRLFSSARWWAVFGLSLIAGVPFAIGLIATRLIANAIDPSKWLLMRRTPRTMRLSRRSSDRRWRILR